MASGNLLFLHRARRNMAPIGRTDLAAMIDKLVAENKVSSVSE
jgi:hypothetical protein